MWSPIPVVAEFSGWVTFTTFPHGCWYGTHFSSPRESHQERPYNPEGLKLPDCTDQWMPNPSASFTLTSAMVSMSPLADELNTKNGEKN